MGERSARRNHETGCQNGPFEAFPLVSLDARGYPWRPFRGARV